MEDDVLIDVERLCRLAHERGLQELTISAPEMSLSIKTTYGTTTVAAPVAAITPAMQAVARPAPKVAKKEAAAPEKERGVAITSPLVGIFYRTASPDSPPFVELGDTVEKGQVIGIIEAMKVFNEITADKSGVVIALPVATGALVHEGDPLVVLGQLV
ncbi:MAG: acetyl-CoA carboxylase biotin carboxyl carrier protein [bacterium]